MSRSRAKPINGNAEYIDQILQAMSAKENEQAYRRAPSAGKKLNKLRRSQSRIKEENEEEQTDNKKFIPGDKPKKHLTIHTPDIAEKGLRVIDFSCKGMTSLVSSVFQTKDVGELDVSSNNLRIIPAEVRRLSTLRILNLSRNGIRCTHPNDYSGLPQELASLQHLEILCVSECNLPFVPPVIWRCKSLTKLDLSRNKIQILMPDIGNLTNLQYLNLQQTALATLPSEIAYCEELEEIVLWGNPLESLPETMKEMHKLCVLSLNPRSFCSVVDDYMNTLLKKGQIQSEHIPQVIFEIPELELLDLEYTKLNTIPANCYCNLQEFYLNNNYFTHIPKAIYTMAGLKLLDMSNNSITHVDDEISTMLSLEVLVLNNNRLEHLNGHLGYIPQLKELEICSNNIRHLPGQFGKLKMLKILRAARNKINIICDAICELPNLHTLDVSYNQITHLPLNFYKLKKMVEAHSYRKFRPSGLWLHKNPMKEPPEIIWKTTETTKIFDYLRKLQISKTENLQRQKLIVLGQSQSGKTSLIRALTQGKSQLTKAEEDATRLVDLALARTDNGIPFCVMDFSGHEIYEIMYPLFLDEKSMYFIVYDHSKYKEAEYHNVIGRWIDMLNTQAPGAVVKVVGTHLDMCGEISVEKSSEVIMDKINEQLEEYQKAMTAEHEKITEELAKCKELQGVDDKTGLPPGLPPHLVNLHHQMTRLAHLVKHPLQVQSTITLVSSDHSLRGLRDLTAEVEVLAIDDQLFPHAQKYIPPHWSKFRAALKQSKKFFLTWEEVVQFGERFHMVDGQLMDCMKFIRSIGEVLWYEEISQIKHMVFHKPRQLLEVLKGIYRYDMEAFLNFQQNRLFVSRGKFDETSFEEAKQNMLQYGMISRPLLQCLFFYLQFSYDEFYQMIDLLPKLDLMYAIPQPEIPTTTPLTDPLVVLPWYIRDRHPSDMEEVWPQKIPPKTHEARMTYKFPMHYPTSVFERLSCRIHNDVLERIDWQNLVYAKTEHTSVILTRDHNDDTRLVLRMKVRGDSQKSTSAMLVKLHVTLMEYLSLMPGLIWHVSPIKIESVE